jgi:plasmid stability protein
MANLTLTIDDDLLKRARMRALQRDTSVNALVREYLEQVVSEAAGIDPLDGFLALSEPVAAGSGPGGRTWTREELHER